mmetsp:Transcript_29209/g.43036  ORF Transcript_29209/g.43036 Transcript_29209/m.43036 type:complete len:289 (-) Transcript_29209:309-1175(-)|eukprot:CAMPEP_0194048858 /NCGR_PEP_ID=MMETSP0009_2-20130614/28784_1 /TAXON_ID=210454 /ORGANISM="Grammatophora oceanica, Strain CCMP 410" /LENGTH=288 /DNA_ID=CAMNT_0038694865 /DNA_START=138 /DNA_END=1004 /DNA_ORIENTATION=-
MCTATSPQHQPKTIVVDTTEVQKLNGSINKRRRRPRNSNKNNRKNSDASSTDGSYSSSDNSSKNSSQQQRRRNRNTKRNNRPAPTPKLCQEEKARYVALDCEMVGIGYGGHKSALARVTMIDWDGNILLDQYVLPQEPVTDYRTFVSGITEEHLVTSGISFMDCRAKVLNLLENKILVGHGLKNDMQVLQIHHPWYLVRDTAKYEPFMKVRFEEDGVLWPRKLSELTKCKLQRDIQILGKPHSPLEDAQAALDLYKRASVKWEKAMAYKVAKTQSILAASSHQPVLAQ